MTEVAPSRGPQPTPPPPDAEVLRIEEVAYLLGRISPRSVRRMIATGKLKALDIIPGGTALRVRRQEVERYLGSATYADTATANVAPAVEAPAVRKAPVVRDDHDPIADGPRVKFKRGL